MRLRNWTPVAIHTRCASFSEFGTFSVHRGNGERFLGNQWTRRKIAECNWMSVGDVRWLGDSAADGYGVVRCKKCDKWRDWRGFKVWRLVFGEQIDSSPGELSDDGRCMTTRIHRYWRAMVLTLGEDSKWFARGSNISTRRTNIVKYRTIDSVSLPSVARSWAVRDLIDSIVDSSRFGDCYSTHASFFRNYIYELGLG